MNIKHLLIIILLLPALILNGQNTNVNPDPNGDPWIAGGLRPLTVEDWEFLDDLPVLELPENYQTRDLPYAIDNSQQPYFRPIFNQQGGSCGQASGIGYNFTYEIDFERDIAANTIYNQYPTHYTWNFLNGGVGGGSWHFDGWVIIRANGCPNVFDYGGHFAYGGQSRWMSGYDEYYNGMHNKVLDIFSINVGTYEELEVLKYWMHDHLIGAEVGGIACFAAGVSDVFTMTTLPSGTPEAGKSVITYWGAAVNHAMTFIGYNDSIRYDFNNDGYYTTDQDINADGVVDLKDCEIGGLMMANSWGTGFGNAGKAFVMYKLLAENTNNGGIWSNLVHVIRTREIFEPIITIKATVKHTSRNKIRILAGISSDTTSTEPSHVMGFPLFNYQGGDFYMQGGTSEADKTLELGLDITPILSYITPGEPAKFFLQLVEQDPYNEGTGEIISYAIIDYTNGIEEIICDEQNVPIFENGTTTLSVIKAVDFDKPVIETDALPSAVVNEPYAYQLNASGGVLPYFWDIIMDYSEESVEYDFPAIEDQQLIPTDNDDGYAVQDLEFLFPFYGEYYDNVTLLTDGAIIFEEQFVYLRNEEALKNFKVIAPYSSDLMIYPAQGDAMWYSGDENSATFRWKTSKYAEPEIDVDVAVTIYPDGSVEFYYGNDITEGTGWAAGVSKGDGQSYLIAALSNATSIPDDYATGFYAPGFPFGMGISPEGVFSGTPEISNQTWDITFKVTDHYNIFSTKTLAFSTVNVGISDIISPLLLNLEQNVPNPFEHFSIINYQLPINAHTSLVVFDITGKEVVQLVDETQKAGEYAVELNAHGLENGIYFYKLTSGSQSVTKKFILMR